jgi:hypothetical protein
MKSNEWMGEFIKQRAFRLEQKVSIPVFLCGLSLAEVNPEREVILIKGLGKKY